MENKTEIDFSYSTLLKVFIGYVAACALIKLAPFILFLFIAVLIGVTLTPVVDHAKEKGMAKWLAQALVSLLLVGFVAFIFMFLLPSMVSQVESFGKQLPELQKQIEGSIAS